MTPPSASDGDDSFRFEYHPATIRFGAGSVADLEAELEDRGLERALIVCGSTVGSKSAVIDPVTDGLSDRLAGVFDETTPDKRLSTALEARDRLEAEAADVVVSLGGGSSLDVATVASVLAATDLSPAAAGRELAETGTLPVPEEGLLPIVAIPTTLAGADLSQGAGITAAPDIGPVDEAVSGGVGGRGLMPTVAVYDPELVATTPHDVLAGSAMNGFDKGIESLYSRHRTPVTDATARHGLEKLADGLGAFGDGDRDGDALETIVEGIVLVQYGVSRPGVRTLSIVHAFGHGLSRFDDLQQGIAHAVVVPHVLEYLFEQDGVDARSGLLANALGVDQSTDHAAAVVEAVTEIRDGLDLPSQLRDVDGPQPEAFTDVARAIRADPFVENAPQGLDPTVEEIESVLERAW